MHDRAKSYNGHKYSQRLENVSGDNQGNTRIFNIHVQYYAIYGAGIYGLTKMAFV
jgi:hypothetical protein